MLSQADFSYWQVLCQDLPCRWQRLPEPWVYHSLFGVRWVGSRAAWEWGSACPPGVLLWGDGEAPARDDPRLGELFSSNCLPQGLVWTTTALGAQTETLSSMREDSVYLIALHTYICTPVNPQERHSPQTKCLQPTSGLWRFHPTTKSRGRDTVQKPRVSWGRQPRGHGVHHTTATNWAAAAFAFLSHAFFPPVCCSGLIYHVYNVNGKYI